MSFQAEYYRLLKAAYSYTLMAHETDRFGVLLPCVCHLKCCMIISLCLIGYDDEISQFFKAKAKLI